MNRHSTSLSPIELVNKLNEGGWVVSGGHQVRELGFSPNPQVVGASLFGELVKIESGDRSFEVPSDNIALTDPWTVEIRHTFMRKQQRKKIEGGGWREVPAVGIALYVSNPTLKETIRRDYEARAQREKEERERRRAEAHEAARQQFVAKLTSEFVGKKLTEIDVVGENLHIKFEDGSELSAKLDGGDCYDAWINVNNISLRDFERPPWW
ncbi:MAG: hypothetical protein HYY55_04030 [Candidatus Niyogibacteria bacterium]|nr:MAG: hypothetical protein HYY55_04030 [Candidatus Niyogibacteria bacterium]